MSFTAKYFSGVLTGGDANHNFSTGTFSATISADQNDALSGTWTFSGSYIADSSTGPDPYVKNGSGTIAFSGTVTGSLLSGSSNSWKVFFKSPDPRFDQSSYGFLDRINNVFDLDASIEFDLPFINRVGQAITEHFGAHKNNLLATALPPIISIDHYTSNIAEDGKEVLVTLVRSGADLGGTSSVFLSTEDGAAVSSGLNVDFVAANNIEVIFAAGITSRTLVLTTINDDWIQEANENFHIRLSAPVNATLGFATGSVTIVDNDQVGGPGIDNLVGGTTNDSFFAGSGNDSLNGGAGIDTAHYAGNSSNYTIIPASNGFSVRDNVGNEGTDTLVNVERLHFANKSVALDLDGNAGVVARILAAVFGVAAVANPEYVGIGLYLLDAGVDVGDVMNLALEQRLGTGFTHAAEVELLFQNLTGGPPPPSELNYWVGQLQTGQFSPASLALMAANLDLNAANINLVGLMQTGIEFIPF